MNGLVRIVKVGGSLFDLPDLPQRLRSWLASQPPATNVLIAGGGALADEVRRWDRQYRIGDECSHWLCIELLDITARMLHNLLPRAEFCSTTERLADAIASGSQALVVFAPSRFLREDECRQDRLPCSWDVTSDSIAARLAVVLGAGELVLLKSSLPEPATVDYVDRYFWQAARQVPHVRFVDLRSEDFAEISAPNTSA